MASQVIADLENDLLTEAAVAASKAGLDLKDFIVAALRQQLDSGDLIAATSEADILYNAIKKTEDLPTGQIFNLKDVVRPLDWKMLVPGRRKSLGRAFRKEVTADPDPIAKFNGKTYANKATYKKL